MRLQEFNAEVQFSRESLLCVGGPEIEALKARARGNPSGKARLCAHHGPDDPLHEMIIVHGAGTYVRPHRHLGRGESFHIIEGSCDVLLFDEAGALVERVRMAPFSAGGRGYCRLGEGRFHALLVRSEVVVFLETTQGPFRPEGTEFAPWAPAAGDAGAAEYLQRMTAAADRLEACRQEPE